MAVTWPQGFAGGGIACGIKQGGSADLGLLVCDKPSAWAGTFTRNAAAAASVQWCRSRLGSPARAIVVNSGNANACTGAAGEKAVAEVAAAAAAELGCGSDQILVSSTGPIGVTLPYEKVTGALPQILPASDVNPFAEAIMTTDTHTKVARAVAGGAEVVGVAKGAAMLAPNMATMLAFLTTDAKVDEPVLQSALSRGVDVSFNRLCIDACESTNDSVFLLSSGTVEVEEEGFVAAVEEVCRDLAMQMAHDAEGGTKVVTIAVEGAADDAHAVDLGKAVASSILWRSAVNGSDPNWGRVASALGAVDRELALDVVELCIGEVTVFSKGEPLDAFEAAAEQMQGGSFTVSCRVGEGSGAAEVVTTDLSTEYVRLNSEGTS